MTLRVGIFILTLTSTFAIGFLTAKKFDHEIKDAPLGTRRSSQKVNPPSVDLDSLSHFPFLSAAKSNTEFISAIANHQNSISRSKALLTFIDTLGPNDFANVIQQLEESGLVELRSPEYRILLSAWAQASPKDAIAYASKHFEGTFAKNTILETWALNDPKAALAWAQKNFASPDSDEANPWLLGVLRGVVATDLNTASSIFESIPRDTPEQREALSTILSHLHATNPESAQEWATKIEDGEIRSIAFGIVAQKMVLTDPVAAAQWVSSLEDSMAFSESAEKIAHHFYLENPEEAKTWTTDLPVWAVGEAANAIVNLTVEENPEDTAQWMSNLLTANPNGNYDPAIETLIEKATLIDPQISAEWITGLTSERQQNKHYQTVLSEWLEKDEQAALDWVQYRHKDLPEPVLMRFFPDFVPEINPHNLDESTLNSSHP